KNAYDKVEGDEKKVFEIPEFMQKMNENGWIGAKAKQGFYQKKKDKDGKSIILQLNPETMEYEDRGKLKTAAVEAAKQQKGKEKCTIKNNNRLICQKGDKSSDFLWDILKRRLVYSAALLGESADNITEIDNAMKWGFGWKLGPFETWDVIGVQESIERMKEDG